MYVIATVFCSNFYFSVSLHVPFSQFLFERDSYSNTYLFAQFCFDIAENELCKVCRIPEKLLAHLGELSISSPSSSPGSACTQAVATPGIQQDGMQQPVKLLLSGCHCCQLDLELFARIYD